MRVLVADSDPRVRTALNLLLKSQPELAIVRESSDGSGLLAQVQELRPDLVLVDWELPGESVASLVEQLRGSEIRVVLLVGRPEAEQAARAVGADAFISKMDSADRLLETLQEILASQHRKPVTATRQRMRSVT
jgi:DNA-binding NarL/FixJ family response regulator